MPLYVARRMKQRDDEPTTTLPKGIEVEFDARYPAIFSCQMKNSALLDEARRVSIKGAGKDGRNRTAAYKLPQYSRFIPA